MTTPHEADEKLRILYQSPWADRRCRRRVPAESVADVVSEVLMTAWRRIVDHLDGSELPWLYGVARRVVMNHRRGARRRHRLGAALIAQPNDPPEADVPVVRPRIG
jgi:DNA-directed RNA polymerase specialized sigma24 family protein